jgi:hypothetical protein
MFVQFLKGLGVIDESTVSDMLREYDSIVRENLQSQAAIFQAENPVEVLFRVLAEKFATNSACLLGDPNSCKGKVIGKKSETSIFLFPDTTMEALSAHYRSRGQKVPFSKDGLWDALTKQELLRRSNEERWTRQVRREAGRRVQAWEFEAEEFSRRCAIEYSAPQAEEYPATHSIREE